MSCIACVAAVVTACSANTSSDNNGTTATTTARATEYCPGTQLHEAALAACPAPASVRPGRTCDVDATCPSPDLLFGRCTCDGGKWSCDTTELPKGYDPYPDCPDEGADQGAACYLKASKCIPRTATACFTSEVGLCTCDNYAWSCN